MKPTIKGNINEIIHALVQEKSKEAIVSHTILTEDMSFEIKPSVILSVLNRFKYCNECKGTKILNCGWDTTECPYCSEQTEKGGEDGKP